ncbi:outer membrane protein assembly factor BamD [bacterium]|nr:outer membrane protein assembly factor BamD [bacterium]
MNIQHYKLFLSGILSVTLWICSDAFAVKAVPTMESARTLEKSDPKKAASIYNNYADANPHAPDAAEAKYHEGLLYEEIGEFYKAYKAYQHIIDEYPLYTDTADLLDRQYRIANYFLLIAERPLLGIAFLSPSSEKALEIFQQIVKNAPFSETAAKAQFRLGYAYLLMHRYEEAVHELKVVLEEYPDSKYLDDTVFTIGKAYFNLGKGPEYDQYSIEKSLQMLNRYITEFPYGRYAGEAYMLIEQSNLKLAESVYLIGEYYEKNAHYDATLIYYDDVDKTFKNTFFGEKVRAKRNFIETLVKLELPFKEVRRIYFDIVAHYHRLRARDQRNFWEFWQPDPLSPSERHQFTIIKKMLPLAKAHYKEGESLFDMEENVILKEIRIVDMQKDTQRLKAQIPQEEAILEQLRSATTEDITELKKNIETYKVDKYDTFFEKIAKLALSIQSRLPGFERREYDEDAEIEDAFKFRDKKEQEEIKIENLISTQESKIKKIHKKIARNEKIIAKLGSELVAAKEALEQNRDWLEDRKQSLFAKSRLLGAEYAKLLSDEQQYQEADITQLALSKENRPITQILSNNVSKLFIFNPFQKKQIQKISDDISSDIETTQASKDNDTPDIIEQLRREALQEKKVVIPYSNMTKEKWYKHWWPILYGEEERIRTPKDAEELQFQ